MSARSRQSALAKVTHRTSAPLQLARFTDTPLQQRTVQVREKNKRSLSESRFFVKRVNLICRLTLFSEVKGSHLEGIGKKPYFGLRKKW